MDMDVFAAFKSATDPKVRRRLHDRLVRENTPLAVKILGQMLDRRDRKGADRFDPQARGAPFKDDCMQAALIALAHAIEKYNPEKGKFSVYVKHWIRHELQQCLLHDVAIYRPKGQVHSDFGKLEREIFAKEGRELRASDLNMTEEEFDAWKQQPHVTKSLEDQWNDTGDQRPDATKSVDQGVDTAIGGLTLEHTLAADEPNPEDALAKLEEEAFALEMLEILTPPEREIVKAIVLEGKGVSQVCKSMGLTQEQAFALRDSALEKLRDEVQA